MKNNNNARRNYYMKYDRLSKTKTVIKFYRNNLSVDMFKVNDENARAFEEDIKYKGCTVHLNVVLKTNDFEKVLHNSKNFKIKGFYKNFSIFSRIDIKSFPGVVKGETEFLKYRISFSGNIHKLQNSFAIKRRQEKNKKCGNVTFVSSSHSTNQMNKIPTTIKQNAFHPYQGGRVSPK